MYVFFVFIHPSLPASPLQGVAGQVLKAGFSLDRSYKDETRHSDNLRVNNQPDMSVFVLREQTGVPGENLCMHGERNSTKRRMQPV